MNKENFNILKQNIKEKKKEKKSTERKLKNKNNIPIIQFAVVFVILCLVDDQ